MRHSVLLLTPRWPARLAVWSVLGTVILLVTSARGEAQLFSYEKIALTGEPATAIGPGVSFERFFSIVLNDSGQVAFQALFAGSGVDSTNQSAIFLQSHGQQTLIARNGDAAPGGDAFFTGLSRPILNDAGQLLFRASLDGPTVTSQNNSGVVFSSGSALEMVAREGDDVPGMGPNIRIAEPNIDSLVLNASGRSAFWASFIGNVNPINHAIFDDSGAGLGLVLHSGQTAPVGEPGVELRNAFTAFAINDSGQLVFKSELQGTGVGLSNDSVLLFSEGDSLNLAVREGAPVSNAPGLNLGNVGTPTINNAGDVAFWAGLTGSAADPASSSAIFALSSDGLNLIAREGDQAPGLPAGVVLTRKIGDPVLSDAGSLAFYTELAGPGLSLQNDSGLFTYSDGELNLLAREGDQAPGLPAGVKYRSFGPFTLNGPGRVLFGGLLTGAGVSSTNDSAVFATDPTGEVHLLLREGELFEVDPHRLTSDLRTISSIHFAPGSGGSDGLARGFSDSGQLAFGLVFADGSEGLFVATLGVPEPASAALALLGIALRQRTSRRLPATSSIRIGG